MRANVVLEPRFDADELLKRIDWHRAKGCALIGSLYREAASTWTASPNCDSGGKSPKLHGLGFWGAPAMVKNLSVFVVGLIVGVYLAASYSDSVVNGFQTIHVPLLGHHASMMSR